MLIPDKMTVAWSTSVTLGIEGNREICVFEEGRTHGLGVIT